VLQVEHQAFLVAVDGEEIGTHAAMPHRPEAAHRVALRCFHLDDFDAHVAKQLRRHRPKNDRCQIDDANSGERPRHQHSPAPHRFCPPTPPTSKRDRAGVACKSLAPLDSCGHALSAKP
jgi:hypothetical protein